MIEHCGTGEKAEITSKLYLSLLFEVKNKLKNVSQCKGTLETVNMDNY